MPSYDYLQLCSFQLKLAPALVIQYATVNFPVAWTDSFKSLLNAQKGEKRRSPIQSLNSVLAAYLPGIISITKNADFNATKPWLFCCEPIDNQKFVFLVQDWIFSVFSQATDEQKKEVANGLNPSDLIWSTETLTFNNWEQELNGTAKCQDSVFTLLPDYLVNCLSGKTLQIETQDGQKDLKFYRAIKPELTGTELISESIEYLYSTKKSEIRWLYSIVINFTVQTYAWVNYPVINCDFGLRRWVSKPNSKLIKDQKTSVFIKINSPWNSNSEDGSFLVAKLKLKPQKNEETGKTIWRYQWVDSLSSAIEEIGFKALPEPEALLKSPLSVPEALITFKNGVKPKSIIKLGLTPGDRKALLVAVAEQLPVLELVARPQRVDYNFTGFANNPFLKLQEIFSNLNKTSEKIQKTSLEIERNNSDNLESEKGLLEQELSKLQKQKVDWSKQVQNLVRERLNGQKIKCHFWQQETETKELIVSYLREVLGETCEITTEGLDDLGVPLPISNSKKVLSEVQKRAEALEKRLSSVNTPAIAYIELQEADYFNPSYTDPKSALRWGHSRLGWKSQFITPSTEKNNPEHRAKEAVLDGLRQLILVPPLYPPSQEQEFQQLSLFPFSPSLNFTWENEQYSIPSNLSFVALWVIRKNGSSKKSLNKQVEYLPVFVYVPANISQSGDVKVYVPGVNQWIPYGDIFKALTTGDAKGYKAKEDAKGFVQKTISTEILTLAAKQDVVFFVHAQNARGAWSWLSNRQILQDCLTFDEDDTPIVINKYPGLRLIRLRDKNRSETPEYWAANEDESDLGYSKGLWKLTERIFLSSTQTPETKKFNRHLSKLTNWVNQNGKIKPPAAAQDVIMPNLLEITVACQQPNDKPWVWAALSHEFRYVCFNYDNALAVPLPLHLAKQIEEYSILLEYLEE